MERDDRQTATVIGGGPAGLIAAETLAKAGLAVTVYDAARTVARKFMVAGRGGLNLTHSEPRESFVRRYDVPDWIGPQLAEFGVEDLRAWAESLGEATFVGSSGRVFPGSFRATRLLRAWLSRLAELGVSIVPRHRWTGWSEDGAMRLESADGSVTAVASDVTVFALGGASWPRTGSDGGWVASFEAAGIEVVPLRPANAGLRIAWSPHFERFAGEPIKNVAVSVRGGGDSARGDVIVSEAGLEGGPIYGVGRQIRETLERGDGAKLHLDLHPDQSREQLVERLRRRRPKDSVSSWLRRSLHLRPVALGLVRESTGNQLPESAEDWADLIKQVTLAVESLMPVDKAISTAGGVARSELDRSLMLRSRPGVFVAGEMIDWEAPTGGYLMQASFSSGVVAARGALQWLADRRSSG